MIRSSISIAAMLVVLCACSGASNDGSFGPSIAEAPDAGDARAPVADSSAVPFSATSATTFASVYSSTLAPICSTCHGGPNGVAGMDFTSKASAYASLVNVHAGGDRSACGASGLVRVKPGASAQSLLYLKVSGRQPCGARMPLVGDPLDDGAIAAIGAWIDEGAPTE